tara:strand:- start:4890 stop:5165 length:276 start_codon:yes stop_codon:yes gene_type:complete
LSITKKDIARNIKLSTSSNNKSCNDLVSSFFDILKSQSLNHDIKISNFGTFKKKITPERIGRNPKTGEEHVITERVKLNLVVSNKVKETLN